MSHTVNSGYCQEVSNMKRFAKIVKGFLAITFKQSSEYTLVTTIIIW